MIVKVCGLTTKTELNALQALGVDWGGLIFVPSSPRYVGKTIFTLPNNLKKVGVFRNESFHVILRTAQLWHFRSVQLHGDETPQECERLRKAGLEVIKAIPVTKGADLDELTIPYLESVDFFLFDSPGGGTGHAFDWKVLSSYTGVIPFLLAGGIAPGFGESLKQITHPKFKGVDLNSRFEKAPGQKVISLLKKFFENELLR